MAAMMAAIDTLWRDGLAALVAGQPERAVPLLRAAVAAGEGGGLAVLNLGLALMDLGRLDEALPVLLDAAARLPDHPEPWFRLGTLAGLRRDPVSGAAHYRAALARDPQHILALAGLAVLEEEAGRLPEAASLFATARALAPDEPELVYAAARIALAAGDLDAAAAHAAATLALRPGHAGAGKLLAEALYGRDGPEAASAAIAAAAAAAPLSAGHAVAAARLHDMCGRGVNALAELRTAELLAPDDPDVLAALGDALATAQDHREAERVLRAAIALRPTAMHLRNRLATVMWRQHRYVAMVELLDAALQDFGPEPMLLMNRALALNTLGDQAAGHASAMAALADPASGVLGLINLLAVQPYHPMEGSAAKLLETGRHISAVLGAPATLPARPADPDRRLRVGLLSGALGRHPVGWLTVAGLEALPIAEIELAAYALGPRHGVMAQRFRSMCALWRDVERAVPREIAELMREDGIDIVIDLGGYGDSGRPAVIQERGAPVQVKWVGAQFASTGLSEMDWMLTDRWETPPGTEHLYSERLLRMPDGYVCYLPPGDAPPVGPLPALANGVITFGCYNNMAKVSDPALEAWARILAAVPGARLSLRTHALGEADARSRIMDRLVAHGLPADRILMGGGMPHLDLLAAYNELDIGLDPFPYTGGLTVCESLWMGVPVVTLIGDSFAGRHAFSHLSNVGLPDWAASDIDAYVTLAIAKARDIQGLAALRTGLRAQVAASPLVDAPRFGRNLAGALRFAWRDWCARQPG